MNPSYQLIKNQPFNMVIYCSGKCGGTTLFQTFYSGKNIVNPYFNPIHIHTNEIFKNCCKAGLLPFEKNENPPDIYELIDKEKPVWIIDSYRDPIDRKISSYFQNYFHNLKYFNVPENLSIEEEVDFFHLHIFHEIEDYESMGEVLKHYGIDKLEYHYKYWIGKKDNITFIRLKFSHIYEWDKILSELLDYDIILKKENLSIDKDYYKKYQIFKKIYYNRYN